MTTVGGHAAEQIIAGVVLSERLAVTPYGAIHRAQWAGHTDLRGLVVDPKLLADDSFRDVLTAPAGILAATGLTAPTIVPVVAIEAGGADVVVVTRGVGRYVTVQDLIVAARAGKAGGGKLPHPVAAAIGKCVVEALAAAHAAGIPHGAVHPRSVLVDEDGAVRLGDFVVGRALATAVAHGAESSLWRGLSGYLAPELAVGEDPTPGCDVFAAGALLFAMLSGEAPPGVLRATPAVERLVQRALDTDPVRRYKTAGELLENLLEAFEDDHWELADRAEVIAAAGLSSTESAIDDATEDLLASLGSASNAVQVTPIRPSMDIRAEVVAARHNKAPTTGANRLDALLADLDEPAPAPAPPSKPRRIVPSMDDVDDDDGAVAPASGPPARVASPLDARRSASQAERAAFDVLEGLGVDDAPAPQERAQVVAAPPSPPPRARKVSAPPPPPPRPPAPVVASRSRAENPAGREAGRPIGRPIEEPATFEAPVPRLKSRLRGLVGVVIIAAAAAGFYLVYQHQAEQRAASHAAAAERAKTQQELQDRLAADQPKSGSIAIKSTPTEGAVWLKLGRTPLDSLPLPSSQMHELRIEGLPGYEPLDTQVLPVHWAAPDARGDRRATVVIPLTAAPKDGKGKRTASVLPAAPARPADVKGYPAGHGRLHIESTPPGAEVWLYLGITDSARIGDVQAAYGYELRVLKDAFHPAYISISPEDWRDGGDSNVPLAAAKLKPAIERAVELAPEKGR